MVQFHVINIVEVLIKKPWNNELPYEWNGAICVGYSFNIKNCNSTFSYIQESYCICQKTGNGWN